jgi:hypothetical protein
VDPRALLLLGRLVETSVAADRASLNYARCEEGSRCRSGGEVVAPSLLAEYLHVGIAHDVEADPPGGLLEKSRRTQYRARLCDI